MFPATVFVSVASGHLTLLAVGQVLQRSLEPAQVDRRRRGGDVPQKNNTAIGHDLVQGFPFVRRNHQKQEESWPSLDYKKICHVCSMTISTAR